MNSKEGGERLAIATPPERTTALDAINITRLAPYLSAHSAITRQKWDGRHVLLLPFREEQSELTKAVAALSPKDAKETVAFAHLAVNKAITQRYVVNADQQDARATNSITYRGLTGPDQFASLARTFTGHFHSHQTITQQKSSSGDKTDLRGSITYLGSPLQLNWADLYDQERGVVLLDPETLEHKLLTNPHAVGYTAVALEEILNDQPTQDEAHEASTTGRVSESIPQTEPESREIALDLIAEVHEYVKSVDLGEPLLMRQDDLVQVGQQMIQTSYEMADQYGEAKLDYQEFLAKSCQAISSNITPPNPAGRSANVFVAEPRSLTITNFLGVKDTIHIDFQQDLTPGLTFLIGDNGSGKSTIMEAMVWCQFGRCIRGGLGVNDVVNDNVGKDCCVKLEFNNGYAITRYRKHKVQGNRVVVSSHGNPLPQFEHPDMRTTQSAINELLGTDYETYIRTVVLSEESAASFFVLHANAAAERDRDGTWAVYFGSV
ncbi:hypothetical protein QC763_0097180 [Podospora pseudopauciseta]|uniref:Rad50/SbcC-type AAA domain-containing protein n=1 Tax=Podospora pseudopauciseta TaxID=2093780 RepID=A0ABR0H5K1_9PEZI|nr:hypothetical protein QC763_0097180 [Podospora pseudopauciseta]